MAFRKSTPEDVRWAYRLLLSREPEEHDILEKLEQNVLVDDLVKFILGSAEFKNRTKSYSTAEAAEPEALAAALDKDGLIHFDDIPAQNERGFIEALYTRILGRAGDLGGVSDHLKVFSSGQVSRLQLVEAFMTSDEFVDRQVRVKIGRIG